MGGPGISRPPDSDIEDKEGTFGGKIKYLSVYIGVKSFKYFP